MRSEEKFGFSIFFVAICGIAVLGYSTSSVGTAGIQISHNGKPLNNLQVNVYLPGYANEASPQKVLTTDGTGIATFTVTQSNLWSGNSVKYGFSVNGTSYLFSEPLTQIVEVSV